MKNIVPYILLLLVIGIIFQWLVLGQRLTAKKNSVTSISPTQTTLPKDRILVKGYNYGFTPKEITVKEGQTVKIRLVSDDSPHTFTIDDLKVNQQFTYGQDKDLTFVASKKGTFQIYCAVPGHKENGMIGVLKVM